MNKENTVFILGAGFSANAGIAIQKDFMKLLIQSQNYYPTEYDRALDEKIIFHIKKFMREVFFWNEGDAFPTLEEVFTSIDISASSGHNLGSRYKPNKLRAIRRLLIYKMFLILDNNYNAAENIYKLLKYADENNCMNFISLNWDIVLEKELNSVRPPYDIDYGFQKKKIEIISNDVELLEDIESERGSKVRIAKVHGSSNWVYCDNCKQVFYSYDSKLAKNIHAGIYINDIKLLDGRGKTSNEFKELIRENNEKRICPICKNALGTHIATFSFKKSFRTYAFYNSWQLAEQLLNEATKWVFIGYSLPDADFEFKHMLKCAQVRYETKKEIVVVTNTANNHGKYKALFGKNNVNCFEGGLEKYVGNL